MNNKSGQNFKPAETPPGTSEDQQELFRRINRQVPSPASPPLPVSPNRQHKYAVRPPEAHSA
jgi:hypothetical protein